MQSYDGGFGMVPGSESHGKQFHLTFLCVTVHIYHLHLENLFFACHWAMGLLGSHCLSVLASQVEELFVLLQLSI